MDPALQPLADQIDFASQRLLGTARIIDDSDLREPSLLPGWTRAHVLAHLARGSDALRNLMVGARTGQPKSAYASPEARAADIEAGAQQTRGDLLDDVAASDNAFRTVSRQLPDEAWATVIDWVPGLDPFPAREILVRRLVEIELHHVDLGAGYTAADWPDSFLVVRLPEPLRAQREERRTWDRTAPPLRQPRPLGPRPARVMPW
ncbi:MAG TPA: maleylpyruvate isomerase N-terminal domain-containing protein [Streptosporangiaceae bacterium]|jgi:maleylpyruvate isomerase